MPSSIPSSENITRRELPNGVVLLVRENFDARSVVISGGFAAGAIFEDPAKAGLAAITAEALTYGTTNRDYATLNETLESGGLSLDYNGGRYLVSFSGKALAEDFELLAELWADTLRNPTFPAEYVEIIKAQVLTGLQYSQQDTRYRAGEAFRKLLYPSDHIQHRESSGTIETVQNISAEDLRAYHAAQYGPAAMIIAVVGAVEAEKVVSIFERLIGDWQNQTQKSDFTQPDLNNPAQIQSGSIALKGKTQSDIILGVIGPSRFDTDYQAARMANNVLGVFGMMGRLGKSVREEKGLAYYSYSSVNGGLHRGAWQVSAGVSPKDVKLAIESIRLEIARMIDEPVSAEDLADNQANLTGRLPLILESNSGVASNLIAMERYKLGLDYLQNYHSMIYALTLDDVKAAMGRYWHPEGFCVAVAGPELEAAFI